MTDPLIPDTLWDQLSYAKFTDDGRQIVWDISSLDKFNTCARLYEYGYVENWRFREPVATLSFGTAVHAGLEVFDMMIAQGSSNRDASVAALRAAAESGQEPLKNSEDNRRTLYTLMRAIACYTEEYDRDPVKTALLPHDGAPAVEVRFEVPIPGMEGHRLSGRIDRLGIVDDQIVIVEHKTTDSTLTNWFWRRFSPNTQVYGYVWALREALGLDVSGVLVDAIQTGVGFTRFGRQLFQLTEDQTDEWISEAKGTIQAAEDAHRRGVYRRNFSSCGNYGGCKFRGVCSRTPGDLRTQWLEADFVRSSRPG